MSVVCKFRHLGKVGWEVNGMKKVYACIGVATVLLLSACNEAAEVEEEPMAEAVASSEEDIHDQREQIKSQLQQDILLPNPTVAKGNYLATTVSDNGHVAQITYYESDKPYVINDDAIPAEAKLLARLKVTSFVSEAEVKKLVGHQDYTQAGGKPIQLNKSITAYQDAGAGSVFTGWNEGNWAMSVRALTANSEKGVTLAKEIVDYLDTHLLPPPVVGLLHADAEGGDNQVITWQMDHQLYHLEGNDIMTLLAVATSATQ